MNFFFNLLTFLLFFSFVILSIVVFRLFKKYLKLSKESDRSEITANKEPPKKNNDHSYCLRHPEQASSGMCVLSKELLCKTCLTNYKDYKVSKKYLSYIQDFEWEDYFIIPHNQEGRAQLDLLSKEIKPLWQEKDIPLLTINHFEVNSQIDQMKRYTIVKIRSIDKEFLKSKFHFLKKVKSYDSNNL